MTISANEVIERLSAQIKDIAKAGELAGDGRASMQDVYDAIDKCRSSDCGAAHMIAVYDAILAGALLNRETLGALTKQSEDVASVYFIVRDDGLVKIGYSHDPENRIFQLRQQYRCGMKILSAIKGARKLEQKLHARFASSRVEGEWFRPTSDLMAFIDATRVAQVAEKLQPSLSFS